MDSKLSFSDNKENDTARKWCWTKISNENAPAHTRNSHDTALDRYPYDRMIRIQQSKSSTSHPDSVVDKPNTIRTTSTRYCHAC
ncbi:hypothetical protein DCAR_0311483 [Daucus carota subsp. sativus]|uniref:Uncharacterized protein n=1 Tax=Daucus carota subsp. sativus TaxID=79200 RepID=A0A166AKQ9_DAUCS|nr:hypothetical protein DCAR_0311483 [Daucus carota subsp. sativus]